MKIKVNIQRELKLMLALAALLMLIAFAEREQHDTLVKDIAITIDNIEDNHFMEEEDVRALMQVKSESLVGSDRSDVSLKEIERRIKTNKFVDDAELYSDLKGNLLVTVELRRPVARIVRNDGADGYVAEDGTVMPVSEKFTSRVMLISGSYVPTLLSMGNLHHTQQGKQLMELLELIREDDFWKAQIAQVDINSKAKVVLFPQVGDESIEFGTMENMEAKFNKLMIFYKEILPAKGWNKYTRVNLEYEGQIVAE
jgi:cell division protein FtsQ